MSTHMTCACGRDIELSAEAQERQFCECGKWIVDAHGRFVLPRIYASGAAVAEAIIARTRDTRSLRQFFEPPIGFIDYPDGIPTYRDEARIVSRNHADPDAEVWFGSGGARASVHRSASPAAEAA